MKNVTTIRVRHAAAAAGVGLLLALSACSGSPADDEPTSQGESEAQGNDGAEEIAAEDDSPEETPEETAEEPAEDEGEAPAGDVVAPAEDFDPCTVVTADQVSDIVDVAVSEGASDEMMGSMTCTFAPTDGQAASVLLQWIPVAGAWDATVDAATAAYDDVSDPEDVTVPGTSRAVAVTGETMGMPAAVVIAEVDGGFFQVVVIGESGETDQAVALTELAVGQV